MNFIVKDKANNNFYVNFKGDFESFGDYLANKSRNDQFIKCINTKADPVLLRASEIIRVLQLRKKRK